MTGITDIISITAKQENEATASAFSTDEQCPKCKKGDLYLHHTDDCDVIKWCINCDWRNYEIADTEATE